MQPQQNGLKEDSVDSAMRNGHADHIQEDLEKEERRRAAQRVLGKQG